MRLGKHIGRLLTATLVSAIVIGCIVPTPAAAQPAETLTVLPTRLPFLWSDGAAVFAAGAVYLIGGTLNTTISDAIFRFDPSTATLAEEPARMPGPRFAQSAVWTGREVLIFGGKSATSDSSDILRFNPETHEIVRGANLTSSRGYAPAFWDGRFAWIIGGLAGFDIVRRDVNRYDPASDSVSSFSAEALGFATHLEGTWDGRRVTLFGGIYDFAAIRFDPSTQSFSTPTVKPSPMPRANAASALQIGPYAYVFGGWDGAGVDRILRFRTEDGQWSLSTARLNRSLAHTAAAWTGQKAYIFGGRTMGFGTDLIQVFTSLEPSNILPVAGLGIAVIAAIAIVFVVLARRRRRTKPEREQSPPRSP